MWTWLVGLVLLPILTLTLLATVTCVRRAGAAREAAALEQEAAALADLTRLGFRVADEATLAGIIVTTSALGFTRNRVTAAVGLDAADRWRLAPAATDAALAAVPETSWVVLARTSLISARASIAAGQRTTAALRRYKTVRGVVEQAALDSLERIEDRGGELADGRQVTAAAERLHAAYAALVAATAELPAFFAVYLTAGNQYLARQELAGLRQRYALNFADLRRRDGASLGASWQALVTDPATARFEGAADRLLRTDPGKLASLAEVAPLAAPGLARIGLLRDLVERSIADVTGRIAEQLAAARASLRLALGGTGLIGSLTLLGAWLTARTVARPLHALAEQARLVNRGDLTVPPIAEHGVREVVAVTRVFNDMVGNLGLLGRQTEALARGDLDDSSLTGTLPGALGRSLQGSVNRLSDSLAARDELEERIRHEATHDGLTGLLNRAAATVGLQRALARARRTGEQIAVLVIDIDNVTTVNESHGRRAGDELLTGCAGRFATVARDSDTLARLDSNEFLLIADVPEAADAVGLAERIRAVAADPLSIGDVAMQVTASIGLAVNLDSTETGEALLRDAEAAARRAKAGGGNRIEVYDADLRQQLAAQDTLERALRAALKGDRLELHYQPVVDTASGQLLGFEALCRWTDPELGQVSPELFIPAAERTDLILDLDRWVLGVATRQLAAWRRDNQLDVHIAVNVSGRHLLRGDIVGAVEQALSESGLAPADLVIEITETVLVADLLKAVDTLTALRRLGVRVAIDDFGTGYTSIAHLRRLPVDILKIDRSLVSQVGESRDALLVNLLVQTAHTLGLGLVAEGAETTGQLDHLRSIGCESVQGFLISQPMSADATASWIASREPTRTRA